jgi:hypothetical protein
LGDLAKRLEDLEILIEKVSLGARFGQEFTDYCSALKNDQKALTAIRWIAVGAAFFLIILLLAGLTYFMFGRGVLFWLVSDASKATIIVAVIGGSIALLIVILRGAFRTIAERNNDDVVPEHMKALYAAAKSAIGKE